MLQTDVEGNTYTDRRLKIMYGKDIRCYPGVPRDFSEETVSSLLRDKQTVIR